MLSDCSQIALIHLLPRKMKIDLSRLTSNRQTDGRTDIVTPWTVGAKKRVNHLIPEWRLIGSAAPPLDDLPPPGRFLSQVVRRAVLGSDCWLTFGIS